MANHSRHRGEQEIAADILATIMNGVRKTHVMYGANLSYALVSKYLRRLSVSGLIRYDRKSRMYMLTCSGRRYLEEYSSYKRLQKELVSQVSLLEEKRNILTQMLEKE